MTTTPHPSPTPAGSALDGDPRILIPLPEAAERLSISAGRPTSWPAPAASRPPAWAPGICMCQRRCCAASSKKASRQPQRAVRWHDPPGRRPDPPHPPAGQP
jgi:hypothetical protein